MTRGTTITALLLLIAACARIVPPSGGPEDRDPPEIVSVNPVPGLCDTIPGRIVIEYSERLRPAEGSLMVYPSGRVSLESRRIIVHPGLEAGVFRVSIPGGLADLRGNLTLNPVNMVWNTVPADSFAAVSATLLRGGGGSVTTAARCDIFLLPDTSKAVLTQFPDSTGGFLAGWLFPGDYRFIAYEDTDRSRTWDMEREPGALQELRLAAGDTTGISLTMTITDSIGPVMAGVEALDAFHIEIIWNEQVSSSGDGWSITVTADDSSALEVLGISASAGRAATGKTTVYTAPMTDQGYSLALEGIPDLSGNPSLPDTIRFWGSIDEPSADYGVQSAYPDDGGMGIPPGGPFQISFTDHTPLEALESLYTVTRVADSAAVHGTLHRLSPTAFSFTPESDLLGERQYRVDLLPGLVSIRGDTLQGRSWTFRPAWSLSPGSVSGRLTGVQGVTVTVVAAPAGGTGEAVTGGFPPGSYLLEGLSGGRYVVSAFVDRNLDGIWNRGEPYGAWPGVVEVFPGMDTPGTDIQVIP